MRLPQFSLKTLLWLVAIVAAFLGGAKWGNRNAGDLESSRKMATELWIRAEKKRQQLQNELDELSQSYDTAASRSGTEQIRP